MDLRDQLQRALGTAYRIERELGQGGMALVFLAEDEKHQRRVAVKVLRPELAAALGADRFTREIRIAARLQHPHILPLLDSGESQGFLWYVMPYVDGPSLRERLAREGELPVHDAVRLLVEITDALAFAHAQGVVHRDIKPDNVMLSGRHALVMDFGVAKAVSEAGARAAGGVKESLTSAGVALGTPAYMAPEQATADPNLDHRVDIYAVGVMAYELLTGRTPFHGRTPQQTLAAHVTEPPAPMTRYRPSLSAALQAVVMRCLAKHPADRWQTAQELLTQLEPLLTPSGGTTPTQTVPVAAAAAAPAGRRLRWAVLGAVALALAIGAAWALVHRRPAAIALGRRTQVTLEPGLELDPALSPDGKLVAYSAGPSGMSRSMLRQLDGGGTIELTPGVTGDLRRPQWTPDGSRVAYQSPRGIDLVPALGGAPKSLVASTPGDTAADLAWSPDGSRIVYRRGDTLYLRQTAGGAPRSLVRGGEVSAPSWSPDGRWIAYVSGNPLFLYGPRSQLGNFAPSRIMVVRPEGGSPIEAAGGNALNLSPVWLPDSRRLLFVSSRDGGRDVYRVALDASGRPAAPPERITTGLNAATISVTPDARRLAYAAFTQTANVWASGTTPPLPHSSRSARPITTGNQVIESFDVSHDGRWLAFDSDRTGNQDIFRMPLAGGEAEQLTSDAGDDFQPSWSHDDREIGFHTFRNGRDRDLYEMSATGSDQRPVVSTPGQERDAGWSPDDRRMSFASDVSGTMQVYTIARDSAGRWGAPVMITRNGGIIPFWSEDGRTLAYNANRGGVWLVPANGGTARPLAMTGALTGRVNDFFAFTWMPDSRRVLIVVSADTMPYQTVWSVPIDGGAPARVLTLDDPAMAFGRGTFVVRDTTLYFAQLRSESDIWTADLGAR